MTSADDNFSAALQALNPWAGEAVHQAARRRDAAFVRARRRANLERLSLGQEAWNFWGQSMRQLGRAAARTNASQAQSWRAWRDLARVDFDGARFEAPLDMAGLVCPHDVTLRAVLAQDALYLAGARIDGVLDLSDAVVGVLDLTRLNVAGGVRADRLRVDARADLSGVDAGGRVHLVDAVFAAEFFARGAYWNDVFDASGARFGGEAGLHGAAFLGPTSFRGATFSDNAGFEDARFGAHADFEKAVFERTADFRRARFDAAAPFGGAQFASAPKLDGAHLADLPATEDQDGAVIIRLDSTA